MYTTRQYTTVPKAKLTPNPMPFSQGLNGPGWYYAVNKGEKCWNLIYSRYSVGGHCSHLSPRISMYLGIQYASSWSVMPPFSSHCPSLSVLSISNWVLNSFEQRSRWAAVSHILQLGHLSSGHGVAEYRPTWTLVPQKPEFCLNLQILYMPGLFFSARSRCSKSTLLNCSFGHGFFFLLPKYCLATSLLAWNLIAPTICHLEEACVSAKCIYWRRPPTVSIYIAISLGLRYFP